MSSSSITFFGQKLGKLQVFLPDKSSANGKSLCIFALNLLQPRCNKQKMRWQIEMLNSD